ncbi:sugar phosphate isomerase/epimerase [Bacillus infantis]|uniref:Sugar phosphate isomerase/epimerase n=1 Tax=Bacillus infantis TaxID=324767 RepID=A0A5D4SBA4_9BACI|nr:TIM barrel protein [Bacillus infantis]TYS60560.1 sugar phosphate isomerase/epimerase [Bacillus infantis]
MKITAMNDEISLSLEKQLETLERRNIYDIDLRAIGNKNVIELTDNEVDYVRKTLSVRSFKVSCLSTNLGKEYLSDISLLRKRFQRAIFIAHRLEAQFIRIFSFFREDYSGWESNVIAIFKEFNDIATSHNLTFLIENEPATYTDNIQGIHKVFDSISLNNFGLLWDTGNFAQMGIKLTPTEFLSLIHLIRYVHIKDIKISTKEKVLPGDGDCSISEYIKELHKIKFSGYLCLEPLVYFNEKYSQLYSKEEIFLLSLDKVENFIRNINNK